ncbi:hypothetical protein [Streptomyces sp. NRRL S-920]|uniref:hypothetical protein n=1 Tax=Streptomyces sp. NRRL S-920 TaxID=1463921 RepID=UPI00068B0BF8|nr:hypothetical protein [Streptomyces sp. NRRL S-920]
MSTVPTSIVLVDGEHYPPVTARAIARMREAGEHVVLALLVGGGEKLGTRALDLGVPVRTAQDPERALAAAIVETGATRVLDLSDEPVLHNTRRFRMASIAVWREASYVGPDFVFTPPHRPPVCGAASVAVIGMGKRTGKTAVSGAAARAYRHAGLAPVIVAMGRGGPAEPQAVAADAGLTPETLLEWADRGRHAASDHIEDALTTGVPTVGTWRAGGGLAGAPFHTDYDRALEKAVGLDPEVLVLESSGASIPPAAADATILVVDVHIDPVDLYGYFGLYRLLLADLVVLTMCEGDEGRRRAEAIEAGIAEHYVSRPNTIRAVLRPYPMADVAGKQLWLATTAPRQAGSTLAAHLEHVHGAHVVGISHALGDRRQLAHDLGERAPEADVLAVELKAAGVDVVTRFGAEHGIETVYVDNRPLTLDGDTLDPHLLSVAHLARRRHATAGEEHG